MKQYKITYKDKLKAIKKANREIYVRIKPTKTKDKKKENNKKHCRNFKY